MLEHNKSTWGDKVRIIGLSIDNSVSAIQSHVTNKGWTNVEHYHIRNGKCTADKEFGVTGVPTVVLVDTNGKIVFIGHPMERDLEKDINMLLEGKQIEES